VGVAAEEEVMQLMFHRVEYPHCGNSVEITSPEHQQELRLSLT
jgi:hypothetical protein